MPKRPKPALRLPQLAPGLVSPATAAVLAPRKTYGFLPGYDFHGEVAWRIEAFAFHRSHPPPTKAWQRAQARHILNAVAGLRAGKRGAAKTLVSRLQGSTGGLLPQESETMALRVECGQPLDQDEVGRIEAATLAALQVLRRPGRPVEWAMSNEEWLLGQLILVWREGTGKPTRVYFNPVTEKHSGAFLGFAQTMFALAGVKVKREALGARIVRAQRKVRNMG